MRALGGNVWLLFLSVEIYWFDKGRSERKGLLSMTGRGRNLEVRESISNILCSGGYGGRGVVRGGEGSESLSL